MEHSIALTTSDRLGNDEYLRRYNTRCLCLWIILKDFKIIMSVLVGQKE